MFRPIASMPSQIQFIADVGIMSGDQDTNLFRPKNDLTRAELMAIIDNALAYCGEEPLRQ